MDQMLLVKEHNQMIQIMWYYKIICSLEVQRMQRDFLNTVIAHGSFQGRSWLKLSKKPSIYEAGNQENSTSRENAMEKDADSWSKKNIYYSYILIYSVAATGFLNFCLFFALCCCSCWF